MKNIQRLDILVSKTGNHSREYAKELIKNGYVSVDGKVLTKPSEKVAVDCDVVCRAPSQKYVSRGGYKLEKALRMTFNKIIGGVCMFFKKKNIYLYTIFSLTLCIIVYLLFARATKYYRTGTFDLIIFLLFGLLPIYSLISGTIQRLFIREFGICLLVNCTANMIILCLIFFGDRDFGLILIGFMIYAVIFISFSFITKLIINLYKKREKDFTTDK